MMQPDKDVSIAKSEVTTAMQHYINTHNTIERISTGSKNIDSLLYGGVETRTVTQFYGAPGSGKTQLCNTMSALVPQEKSDGGACGKSIYIDIEGTFRTERIAVIAKARGFDLRKTLDNVMIEQVANSKQQEQIIDKIESLLKNKGETERFKLLVVDSPVTHYRSEYIGPAKLPERQQKLYKYMRGLVAISHGYNIAVVVTNHINTTANSRKMPVAGNVMGHTVTDTIKTRLLLRGIASHGQYYLSQQLIIGAAVDDAASNHDELEWIGLALSPSVDIPRGYTVNNSVVRYNIPFKQSPYPGIALNWPKFDSNTECYQILQKEYGEAPEKAKVKYKNTFSFYDYVTNIQ